jgi:excinuclease ABC subunit C
VEDIAQVPGVPAEVAQAVYDALRVWDEEAQTVAEKAR